MNKTKETIEKRKISKEEWLQKGKDLFGEDVMGWEFVCPGCGNIQKVSDFKPYKDKGATPNSAYTECIGRYSGGDWYKGTKPCNYAAYGLFNIAPVIVKDGDILIEVFDFNKVNI